MVISSTIQTTLGRHQQAIDKALRSTVAGIEAQAGTSLIAPYYGQMRYHLGWVNEQFHATNNNPGKLLRPTLVILAYEATGAWGLTDGDYVQRAIPAAVAVELTHNFSLIHDDIEDGDEERRHRKTLWKVWGIPQATNTGDGMFALARLALWGVLEYGVEAEIAARLAIVLDQTTLTIAEGQYLDLSFEDKQEISVATYLDMIRRKTAALMAGSAEIGARLGTRDEESIRSLRNFGEAIGIVFQVRDDLLGIWASMAELGKTQAGDVYRRKKSLPFLHALEHASEADRQQLLAIYQQEAEITGAQVARVMTIFERTQTQAYCRSFLAEQCQRAYAALEQVPQHKNSVAARALNDLKTMVSFLEEASKA